MEKIGFNLFTWIRIIPWILMVAFHFFCLALEGIPGKVYVLFSLSLLSYFLWGLLNRGRWIVVFSPFIAYALLFILYCACTVLWSWDMVDTLQNSFAVFIRSFYVMLFYFQYREEEDIWPLFNSYKWAAVFVSLYTLYVYGISGIFSIFAAAGRLDNDFANANSLGLCVAYAAIIAAYEWLFCQKSLLSMAAMFPCLLLLAASGSRKALVVLVLGVLILLFFRYKTRSMLKSIFKMIPAVLLAGVAGYMLLSTSIFSGVIERMDTLLNLATGAGVVDGSTLERKMMVEVGWAQFMKTPILGIGIGASGDLLLINGGRDTYLHNNFIELLCCGGIVAFCLYYAMYYYCFRSMLQYRNNSRHHVPLGITLLLLSFMMGMGLVHYEGVSSWFYIMIFFLIVEKCQRDALSPMPLK